ncbi:MAG: malate synthase, partial [Neobacillus sp.]|nr:malate synthase [Neobacillus sp.]
MSNYVKIGNLQVADVLYHFINEDALPGTDLDREKFWADFETLFDELTPKNNKLLARRDDIQHQINAWHRINKTFHFENYKSFLKEIGYLEKESADFKITTDNVDEEVALKAGPQLVVPVDNARYALNAANARWGSLYDGLYGTDVISEDGGAQRAAGYNPVRGEKVITFARNFLDQAIPLKQFSHKEAVKYSISKGNLTVLLRNGTVLGLQDETKLLGYQGNPDEPNAILFKNNGLYFEIQVDRSHPIGKTDAAGIKDIFIESALTTIMDCEDSVAAVDA